VVMVTHDGEVVERAQQKIVIRDGRIEHAYA
jgi:ABC-type lipoprotein export system ATPase subunit